MTAETRAINCTTCGAGQTILGGGRVQTHVCPYCGSALDALDDFAVLARYTGMIRPQTPLSLGDTGRIRGVEFTVIGLIRWVEHYDGDSWRWTDHQIFSPTHGYGWLTLEDSGHWSFTRKLRTWPRQWLTPHAVERAESRPHLWIGGERMAYYETSDARIDYLEGAFNWAPKLSDRSETITLLGDGRMVTLSGFDDSTEREVEETRLLTPDEAQSFGLTPNARGGHPLAVRPRWRHHHFVVTVAGGFILLTALLGLTFGASRGRLLADTGRVPVAELPIELEFETLPQTRLAQLRIESDVSNGWAWFDIELEDEAGDTVLSGGREISYYFGRDSEGRWSEGSTRGNVTFPVAGGETYTLSLEMSEYGSGAAGDMQTNSMVDLRVSGRRYSWRPLGATAAVFAVILALTLLAEVIRRARILSGSDWTDED